MCSSDLTKIKKEDLKTYFYNDKTLKDFEVPKKTIEEYENWFINMARDRGESDKDCLLYTSRCV